MEDLFGEWLKGQLIQRRMRQTELADKIGVQPPQISRLISGERPPTNQILIKIADALRIPRTLVFGAAGLMPPNPDEDEWDQRIKYLLKAFPPEEKEKIIKRLELEVEFYEQQSRQPRNKSTNKTRP